mmetsp:Transcript_64077/g.139384  ORF Transcript_64077/g.139384 Transcript_64077/m.139384 type:complete len:86 (+) Transcript_64077:1466-1723(+)
MAGLYWESRLAAPQVTDFITKPCRAVFSDGTSRASGCNRHGARSVAFPEMTLQRCMQQTNFKGQNAIARFSAIHHEVPSSMSHMR